MYEVKTDDWDTYEEFLAERTLERHTNTALAEKAAAEACGYRFVFVVGDKKLQDALSRALGPARVEVRHEPRCSRKLYKKGQKTNKEKP